MLSVQFLHRVMTSMLAFQAWLEKNPTPAKHLFQKAMTELLLSDCTPKDIERLAAQAYENATCLLHGRVPSVAGQEKQVRVRGQVYVESSKKSAEGDEELRKREKKESAEAALVWLQIALRLVAREGCLGDVTRSKKTETQRRFYRLQVRVRSSRVQQSCLIQSFSS